MILISINLTNGSDGDIFIADADAVAIIPGKGVDDYSVLAEVQFIANSTRRASLIRKRAHSSYFFTEIIF